MIDGAPDLIILDFDGVVADSELLANTLLSEFLTQEGCPTTVDHSIKRYMGRRRPDIEVRINEDFGRPVPADFFERYHAYEAGRMRREVEAVAGVAAFLSAHRAHRFCVASSSTHDWLNHGVEKFGLRAVLGQNLFSATEVKNGKPAPDIFLHAAQRMGVPPAKCAVLEDSAAGVEGGAAAGMKVIGFLGASHIRDGHGAQLQAAGAHALARNFADVATVLGLVGARL